jgi:hypothetical protein
MKQTKLLTVIPLLTFALTACSSSGAIQAVEVTRIVPQTIEVTRIVQQTAITTPVAEAVILSPTECQPVQDSGYYDGIIVITQYYTFLGHSLYEEAYQLLGPSATRHSPSLEDYVNMAKMSFKTVEIVAIQPLYEWKKQQGEPSITPDSQIEKMFFVQIRAWGEGEMSGSVVSGTLQTLFVTVIQENGEWKIDSFATGPAH